METGLIKLKVVEIKWETFNTVTFFMKPVSGEKITYLAGQFLTLIFKNQDAEVRRSYSLSSSPEEELMAVTIKRVENGELSRHLLLNTKVGDVWNSLPPTGKFLLDHPEQEKDLFYFAAGSGISPIFSHIKSCLSKEGKSKITLVYSNSKPSEAIFLAELEALQAKHDNRFRLINYFVSNDKCKLGKRLNNEEVEKLVKNNLVFNPDKASFYLCGPFNYMRMIRIELLFMGFHKNQIRKENFVTEIVSVPGHTTYYPPRSVTLIYQQKTYQLNVGENQTVLQAALKNEINLPYSCLAGMCSTCAALCRKGAVEMLVNDVLTEADLQKGWILTCTAHPLNDDVIIEFT